MKNTAQTAGGSIIICVVCSKPLSGKLKTRLCSTQLIECQACKSWICLPRPTAEEQAGVHDDEQYFEHPYFQHRRNAQAGNDRRCRQIFNRLRAAIDLSSLRGERLLDVGCDTGAFLLSAARQFGIVPVGVDVSSRAINQIKAQGVEAYVTDLENAPRQLSEFSVITAIDLLEHVVDPRVFLQQLFSRLRPGGVTYLETPNIYSSIYQMGCILSRMTGGRPPAIFERLFPPQHVQYFTRTSFATLAHECGFEVVQLGLRSLPLADLATSLPMRLALTGLQLFDRLAHKAILICGLLRKPFLS
jgi:SAM-dependent methyltransferase